MADIQLVLLLCVIFHYIVDASSAAGSSGVPANVTLFTVGQKLVLHCQNGGGDRFDWYRGSTQVVTNDGISAYINGTLEYEQATEDNVGEYRCEGRDGALTQTLTALIISNLPESKSVALGETLAFTCEAKGPRLAVSWTKDDANIVDAIASERLSFPEQQEGLPDQASMQVTGMQLTDAGTYTCLVTNGAGLRYPTTSTVTVTVSEPTTDLTALWVILGLGIPAVLAALGFFVYKKSRT